MVDFGITKSHADTACKHDTKTTCALFVVCRVIVNHFINHPLLPFLIEHRDCALLLYYLGMDSCIDEKCYSVLQVSPDANACACAHTHISIESTQPFTSTK